MRETPLFFLALLLGACVSTNSPDKSTSPANLEKDAGVLLSVTLTDSKSCTGNIEERDERFVVISDQSALETEYSKDLWNFGSTGKPKTPSIDFEEEIALALYFGPGTCEDEVTVAAVEESEGVIVTARRTKPCVVSALVAYPFAFVSLKRTDGQIRVNFETEQADCP